MHTYYGTISGAIIGTIYFTFKCTNVDTYWMPYSDSYNNTLQCTHLGTYFATFECSNKGSHMSTY